MRTLLHNACIISPGFQLDNAAVLLHGERIERLFTAKQKLPEAEQKIDLEGQWLLPGFIDIHCHGRDNHDFCDASDAAFEQIGKGKLKEGVSGFLATTLTLPKQELRNTFMCARRYQKNNRDGARLLGMHLEGPFFHPDGAGAQNPKYLRPPDFSLVAELHALCPIRIASFSPELPGALPFITQLCQAGIMPSGAHSGADYACTLKAMRAGMRHLTHFCNVMSPLHHLRFGMVGAGLSEKQLMLEIICDGVHLSDPMIKFIFQVKGADSLMLSSASRRRHARRRIQPGRPARPGQKRQGGSGSYGPRGRQHAAIPPGPAKSRPDQQAAALRTGQMQLLESGQIAGSARLRQNRTGLCRRLHSQRPGLEPAANLGGRAAKMEKSIKTRRRIRTRRHTKTRESTPQKAHVWERSLNHIQSKTSH